jgi:hypothetical protein
VIHDCKRHFNFLVIEVKRSSPFLLVRLGTRDKKVRLRVNAFPYLTPGSIRLYILYAASGFLFSTSYFLATRHLVAKF